MFDRQVMRILLQHFPQMHAVGLGGNPVAEALHHSLAHPTPESPSASSSLRPQGAPSTAPAQTGLAPRPARRSTPEQAQAARIAQQLRDAGVDLVSVRRNIAASMQGQPTTFDRRAGRILEHYFPELMRFGLGGNAVAAALYHSLGRSTTESASASSSRTTQGAPSRSPARSSRAPQPAGRSPHETQVAAIVQEFRNAGIQLPTVHRALSDLMHRRHVNMNTRIRDVLQQHFGSLIEISADHPLAAALEHALRPETVDSQIRNAFSGLRPISNADAQRLGFKDAAIHGEEAATACLFGEPLSTRNPSQQVIGLAPRASAAGTAYNAHENGELVFMDLAKLAEYLATKPKHPFTNAQLDASNIHNYAFRIE